MVGIAKRDDGGVDCDEALSIAPGVWLAGDIAAFPRSAAAQLHGSNIGGWRSSTASMPRAACRAGPFVAAPFF